MRLSRVEKLEKKLKVNEQQTTVEAADQSDEMDHKIIPMIILNEMIEIFDREEEGTATEADLARLEEIEQYYYENEAALRRHTKEGRTDYDAMKEEELDELNEISEKIEKETATNDDKKRYYKILETYNKWEEF